MNKVYVVTSGEYSDYGIRAIFSTLEKAERYVAEWRQAQQSYDAQVETWELDADDEVVAKRCWSVRVLTASGDVERRAGGALSYSSIDMVPSHLRSRTCDVANYLNMPMVWADSYVSEEHAIKVAVECYQEWLRLKALS